MKKPPRPHPDARRLLALIALAVAGSVIGPGSATAQTPLDRPLRVFLDCTSFFCDSDFFTQEIPWVQFVRDRQDADVHVLGTQQATGGGGSEYTLDFQGRSAFEGQRIVLRANTDADVTEDERRNALLAAVQQGLAPFAAATSQQPRVEVSPPAGPESGDPAPSPEDDPWNRWVFSTGVNGFMNGESQQRFLNSSGNVSASRITEDWKIRLRASGSTSRSEFELNDSTTIISQTESYSGSSLVGRSLTPHWSTGGVATWRRSTFSNFDHNVRVAAAMEYDLFPYSESNRRLLTFLYSIGPSYHEYADTTLFLETEEWLIDQQLVISYDVTQPWGNIDASVTGQHYITKFGDGLEWTEPQYNVNVFGGFNVRLIKGLQANLHGNFEMVRGQIQLPKGEADLEEVLTRQKELATDFRYFFSFGLSYRFGSIFSNVVNPRLNNLY